MLSLWVDAAIIFGVVVLNALLGFIQEGKAEKALDSIRNMLSAEARAVRGGETRILFGGGSSCCGHVRRVGRANRGRAGRCEESAVANGGIRQPMGPPGSR